MSAPDSLDLDKYLEDYQVKTNRNTHKHGTIGEAAQVFDKYWMQCVLVSEYKIVSIAFLSKHFRAVLILAASCLILSAILNAFTAANFYVVTGRYFRFVSISSPPRDCNISAESVVFQYGTRECDFSRKLHKVSTHGGTLTFTFVENIGITGWSQVGEFCRVPTVENRSIQLIQSGKPKLPDVDIHLQRSHDGSHWHDVKPPWFNQLSWNVTVNLSPPYSWVVREIVVPTILSIFFCLGCFAGVRREGSTGAKVFATGWVISFCAILSCTGIDVKDQFALVSYAILSITSFLEYKILEACVVIWMIGMVSFATEFNAASRTDLQDPASLFHSNVLGTISFPLGCAILVLKHVYRKRLRRMLEADKRDFDSKFASIRQRDEADLMRLAIVCKETSSSLVVDSDALRQPTRNLVQLYDQADALRILMASKLSQWSGSLMGLGEPEGTDWDTHIVVAVKLFACFDGDTAKIYDYCTGGIVFDDIGRLLLCLKVIQGDSSVRILRLENTFNCDLDSAGYRCVDILLLFEDENSRSLGLEKHICRVCLHDKGLAQIRSLETYVRALLSRNASSSSFKSYVKLFRGIFKRQSVQFCSASRQSDLRLAYHTISLEQQEEGLASNMFSRTLSWETEALHGPPVAELFARNAQTTSPVLSVSDNLPCLRDHLKSVFRENFKRAVTSNSVSNPKNLVFFAMADCTGGGVVETSDSLSSTWCALWIAPFYICFNLLVLNKFAACLQLLIDDGKCTGQLFRFTPLELRSNASDVIMDPGISDFGLIRHGCALRANSIHSAGSSLVADFGEEVAVNGWWLTTRDQPPELDPVRFVVDVLQRGGTWARCGASRFEAAFARDQPAGIGWAVRAHETTLLRGATEEFYMSLPWQFAADHVLVFLVHAVTIANMLIGLLCGRPTHAVNALKLSVRACSTLYLISAIGYIAEGEYLTYCVPATYSGLFFVLTGGMWQYEKSVLKLSAFGALAFATAGLVQYMAVFGGSRRLIDGYRHLVPLDILTAFGTGVVCLGIHVYSRYLLYRSKVSAKALVASDYRTYDTAFQACLQNSISAQALGRIEEFVANQWGDLEKEVLRHSGTASDSIWQQRVSPIANLEQLFGQASVLMQFLRAKAKSWALQSEGRFPVLQDDDIASASGGEKVAFERWADIVMDGGMIERVKWSKIKSTKRAVEKIYRCYSGELSRLVDCCRCAVVFTEPVQILECLEYIAADDDVEVVRVNNKLSRSYDKSLTAGYRDVSLNMRIVTERTMTLGVDGHICELQLILHSFAELKTAVGHKNYVLWRNLRGM